MANELNLNNGITWMTVTARRSVAAAATAAARRRRRNGVAAATAVTAVTPGATVTV